MLDSRFAAALAQLSGPGAGSLRGGAHKKESAILNSRLSARAPVWIAGIAVAVLAATGVVVVLRSIPASYAATSSDGTAFEYAAVSAAAADFRANDLQLHLAVARPINRRSRASCAECGVVDSIREIGRPGALERQDTRDVKEAGRLAGGAIGAGAAIAKSYEMTIRFRDGSTMILNEASPRTWRSGTRVMVIGRSIASNDRR